MSLDGINKFNIPSLNKIKIEVLGSKKLLAKLIMKYSKEHVTVNCKRVWKLQSVLLPF